MSHSWNLVCAGPSREHLRLEDLIPDAPVVTTNRAMDIAARGLPVDFAAFADGPSACWTGELEKFWKPGIVLWVTLRPLQQKVRPPGHDEEVVIPGPPVLKLWDKALPASAGFRLMPFGFVEDARDKNVTRTAFTALCAFRRILEFAPKRIRILSMDMQGSWIEGKTEEECHAIDMERNNLDRWHHERTTMERIINRARGEGITVELVTPRALQVA
jgi:hypothetical protein